MLPGQAACVEAARISNRAAPAGHLWQVAFPVPTQALLPPDGDQSREDASASGLLQTASLQASARLQKQLDTIQRCRQCFACRPARCQVLEELAEA